MKDDSEIELKILEAVLEQGHTSITNISKATGISYSRVQRRVNLKELRELREVLDYEKVQKCYRIEIETTQRGMSRRELQSLTHLPDGRVCGLIERAQQELKNAQEDIATTIYYGTLKKALQKNIAFAFAYSHYVKPHVRMPFKQIYRRTKSIIHYRYSSPKCAKRWKVSNAEASRFARALGIGRENKKLFRRGKLYAKILEP